MKTQCSQKKKKTQNELKSEQAAPKVVPSNTCLYGHHSPDLDQWLPLVVSFHCSLTWPGKDAPDPCSTVCRIRCLAGEPLRESLAVTFPPPSLFQDFTLTGLSNSYVILRVGFQQPLSKQGDGFHCRYLLAPQGKPALLLGFHLQTPQSLPHPPQPPSPHF